MGRLVATVAVALRPNAIDGRSSGLAFQINDCRKQRRSSTEDRSETLNLALSH